MQRDEYGAFPNQMIRVEPVRQLMSHGGKEQTESIDWAMTTVRVDPKMDFSIDKIRTSKKKCCD